MDSLDCLCSSTPARRIIMADAVNDIMNHCVTGWHYFSNPRMFPEYGRQKGWEREAPATDTSNGAEKIPEGFVEVTQKAVSEFFPSAFPPFSWRGDRLFPRE